MLVYETEMEHDVGYTARISLGPSEEYIQVGTHELYLQWIHSSYTYCAFV